MVVVIDETLARRYWPAGVEGAQDPIGQRIKVGRRVAEVVGIVGAVRAGGLDHQPMPTIYSPYRQSPFGDGFLLLRHDNPAAQLAALKRAVYAVDREQPVFHVRTLSGVISGSQSATRFTLAAMAVFAGVAILLAAMGIYGVMSYAVAQRRNEIGIRIALGAGGGGVQRMIVGQGMKLACAGVVLGLAGAAAGSRILGSLLYGVSATDASVFAGTAAMLALVALAATWLPARRASRIDPIASLRYE
jgi:putative ABC transport system permease protein